MMRDNRWLPGRTKPHPRARRGRLLLEALEGRSLLSFLPAVDYATVARPFTVLVADFNQDGIPDLASLNESGPGGGGVSVLLGNGDGSFLPALAHGVRSSVHGGVAGDFTGDNLQDIVLGASTGGPISLLLLSGNGDGTFQTSFITSLPRNDIPRVAADLNQDGRLDLVTANLQNDAVKVLLGNGDGTFETAHEYVSGRVPWGTAAADFTGDNVPDLLVGYYVSAALGLFVGNGDGSFQEPIMSFVGRGATSLGIADFNGDGLPDCVGSDPSHDVVSVLLNNGDGTFLLVDHFAVGRIPYYVAAGDFNGDGLPDVAAANSYDGTVGVLPGHGDGTLGEMELYAVGRLPSGMAVDDLNGDGWSDLAVANTYSHTVSVLLNDGGGSAPGRGPLVRPGGPDPTPLPEEWARLDAAAQVAGLLAGTRPLRTTRAAFDGAIPGIG